MAKRQSRAVKRKAHAAQSEPEAADEGDPRGALKFFAAFGIVLLLLVGIVAWQKYSQQTTAADNKYNGFDFAQAEGGIWVTNIESNGQSYNIPFYFHPRDTESVLVDPNATLPLYRRPSEVFISVDPEAPSKIVIAGVEVARITGTKYHLLDLNTRSALVRPGPTPLDVPIMDCPNATQDRVIIRFIEGKENVITRWSKNPNCILLQYTDINESVRVADRYAYMLLKVMK